MEQRLPMEMLSMKRLVSYILDGWNSNQNNTNFQRRFARYELPPPPPNKISDPAAWLECVENSYAQLEQQETRLIIVEFFSH